MHLFGNQAVGAALEADIVAVFEEEPALVVGTIDAVADAFKAGRVRSPWASCELGSTSRRRSSTSS